MKQAVEGSIINLQGSTGRFTPRQLIKYHMEHPEIPIMDADIENLDLDVEVTGFLWKKEKPADDNSKHGYLKSKSIFTSTMLM